MAKPKKKPARTKPPTKPATSRTRKTTAPDWAPAFLAALRRCNVKAACLAAKVGRRTVYDRRDSDPEFAGAMALALDEAADELEAEAWRRAVDGCTKDVYGSGGPGVGTVVVGEVVEYSDSLMQLLLKAHRPEKYRERSEVKHTGGVKHGPALDLGRLSDDQLDQLEALTALARGD